jgi:predicted DNA-binding transcriptional regulator AlpA
MCCEKATSRSAMNRQIHTDVPRLPTLGVGHEIHTFDTTERHSMTSTTMITAPSQIAAERLCWRLKDLPALTGLSLRTVNRLRAEGRLPRPDATFGACLCWRPSTLERWAESDGLCQVACSPFLGPLGEKGTGVITLPRITNSRIWAFRNSTRPLWL